MFPKAAVGSNHSNRVGFSMGYSNSKYVGAYGFISMSTAVLPSLLEDRHMIRIAGLTFSSVSIMVRCTGD